MTAPLTAPMTGTLLARVTKVLPDLHPSERRLADLVLDFPGELGGYTATEIAELAKVSNATVSRFVRRIGYASFDEARRAVRDEQASGTALMLVSSKVEDGSVARHREMSFRNLEATYGGLDDAAIDGLARAMIGAARVWFVGSRGGHAFARYLRWQTSQVLPATSVLPRAGETMAESVASLSADDVVLLLALRRLPRLTTKMAEAVRGSGAALAIIQDRGESELGRADWNLVCATATTGPLMNHVGVMAVCNLLVARIVELSGAEGRARMSAIEAEHARFDEL